VSSFNGLTGAVTGVTAINAGTGISITGTTNPTITNTGVQSWNGSTGAVTGVATFNGATGAVSGVNSVNGLTGAVTGVSTFNGATGAISGVNSVNGLTGALSLLASTGVSIAAGGKGITFTNTGVQSWNGSTGAVTFNSYVSSFNGATGTISGVNSANGLTGALTFFSGTGISVVAGGKGITLINTGVSSVNGLTGAVTLTSVSTGTVNNFTAQQNFTAGLSAGGAITFVNDVYTDSVRSITNNALYLNTTAGGGGGGSITVLGDNNADNNSTAIYIDDQTPTIILTCPNGTIDLTTDSFSTSGTATVGDKIVIGQGLVYKNSYLPTTLGTTGANQTIATTPVVSLGTAIYRTVEYLIQASTSSAFETLRITAIHDSTNTYNTQYALVRSGGSLGTYTTTLTGLVNRSMLLRVTPTTINTTYTVAVTVIPA
jgi:hypothetical protein